MVVAIPDAMHVSDREWPGRKALGFENHLVDNRPPFGNELARRLGRLGIPVLNLLPSFKESNVFPLYFKNDGHFRESCHKLADKIIAKYFDENLIYHGLFKSN